MMKDGVNVAGEGFKFAMKTHKGRGEFGGRRSELQQLPASNI